MRALDDLVHQGKVLYLGISNFPAWQVATALGISAREGLARFECVQPMYSLVKRQAEVELLPLAQHAGLGVCPYNAIGGGVLSGKYAGEDPRQGRLRDNPRYRARYSQEWLPDAVARFVAYARAHGHHPVSLAVAWVSAHPAVTAPLVGARTVAQLEDSLRSLDIRLTPSSGRRSPRSVPHPGVATDRTESLAGFADNPGAGDPGGPPGTGRELGSAGAPNSPARLAHATSEDLRPTKCSCPLLPDGTSPETRERRALAAAGQRVEIVLLVSLLVVRLAGVVRRLGRPVAARLSRWAGPRRPGRMPTGA